MNRRHFLAGSGLTVRIPQSAGSRNQKPQAPEASNNRGRVFDSPRDTS